jgi:hypothetical protein
LTPAEFGALTPAEFQPYIEAKIEREKEIVKMENERVGLIAAILQNGIPTVSVKKTGTTKKPSDYFKPTKSHAEPAHAPDAEVRETRMQHIYSTMLQWVGATKGGGK